MIKGGVVMEGEGVVESEGGGKRGVIEVGGE